MISLAALDPRARCFLAIGGAALCISGCAPAGTPGDTSAEAGADESELATFPIVRNADVDVLFVVGNGPTMGAAQHKLARGFPAFIEVLDDPEVQANYRIAVVSADDGHTGCGVESGTGGRFEATSCKDREADFVDADGTISRFHTACDSVCGLHAEFPLDILATSLDGGDGEKAPRPWIEKDHGVLNLAEDMGADQAFGCLAPQGIGGCRYTTPLESMARALARTRDPEDPAYGFVRDDAVLAVVFVTDQVDCSHNWNEADTGRAFDPDNSTFWSDPEFGPNPSICWNAGVACEGDAGSRHAECVAVDRGIDGKVLGAGESESVLFPIDRYHEALGSAAASAGRETRRSTPAGSRVIATITGMRRSGVLIYPKGPEEMSREFGIGPGCESVESILDELDPQDPDGGIPAFDEAYFAPPPVRLREFAAHHDDDPEARDRLHSICAEDFEPSLTKIAEQIRGELRPGCFDACAADTDLDTAWLEPDCRVIDRRGGEKRELPECAFEMVTHRGAPLKEYLVSSESRYEMPDADAYACFALRMDPFDGGEDETPNPGDDMSAPCVARGLNLEVYVEHRDGGHEAAQLDVEATCQVSPTPETDCPEMATRSRSVDR